MACVCFSVGVGQCETRELGGQGLKRGTAVQKMSERSKRKDDPWGAAESTVSTSKNGRGGARPATALDKAGGDAQTAQNSNSRGGVAVSRKRKLGRMSSEVKLSSHGGHLLLFQDDSTGRKRINVSALRLVLGIIQDETAETIRTAAAELMDRNEKVSVYIYIYIYLVQCQVHLLETIPRCRFLGIHTATILRTVGLLLTVTHICCIY